MSDTEYKYLQALINRNIMEDITKQYKLTKHLCVLDLSPLSILKPSIYISDVIYKILNLIDIHNVKELDAIDIIDSVVLQIILEDIVTNDFYNYRNDIDKLLEDISIVLGEYNISCYGSNLNTLYIEAMVNYINVIEQYFHQFTNYMFKDERLEYITTEEVIIDLEFEYMYLLRDLSIDISKGTISLTVYIYNNLNAMNNKGRSLSYARHIV